MRYCLSSRLPKIKWKCVSCYQLVDTRVVKWIIDLLQRGVVKVHTRSGQVGQVGALQNVPGCQTPMAYDLTNRTNVTDWKLVFVFNDPFTCWPLHAVTWINGCRCLSDVMFVFVDACQDMLWCYVSTWLFKFWAHCVSGQLGWHWWFLPLHALIVILSPIISLDYLCD